MTPPKTTQPAHAVGVSPYRASVAAACGARCPSCACPPRSGLGSEPPRAPGTVRARPWAGVRQQRGAGAAGAASSAPNERGSGPPLPRTGGSAAASRAVGSLLDPGRQPPGTTPRRPRREACAWRLPVPGSERVRVLRPARGRAWPGPVRARPARRERARDRAAGAAERARDRAAGAAERARSGAVGSVQTQMRDLAISHHALVFSALGMVLFVPALISLATLLPLGSDHGLAARMAHHMALSAEAQEAVRDLFSTDDTIRTPTSAVGAVFTVLAAYAWPAELQRFYEAVWGLPSLGRRHLWRPLVWLGSLVAGPRRGRRRRWPRRRGGGCPADCGAVLAARSPVALVGAATAAGRARVLARAAPGGARDRRRSGRLQRGDERLPVARDHLERGPIRPDRRRLRADVLADLVQHRAAGRLRWSAASCTSGGPGHPANRLEPPGPGVGPAPDGDGPVRARKGRTTPTPATAGSPVSCGGAAARPAPLGAHGVAARRTGGSPGPPRRDRSAGRAPRRDRGRRGRGTGTPCCAARRSCLTGIRNVASVALLTSVPTRSSYRIRAACTIHRPPHCPTGWAVCPGSPAYRRKYLPTTLPRCARSRLLRGA